MTADEILALVKTWQRPDDAKPSRQRYAKIDPAIRHLASAGWPAKEIKDHLVKAELWPKSKANGLYHHICRLRQRLANS